MVYDAYAASESVSVLRVEWFTHTYNRGEEAPSKSEVPLCKGIQFFGLLRKQRFGNDQTFSDIEQWLTLEDLASS